MIGDKIEYPLTNVLIDGETYPATKKTIKSFVANCGIAKQCCGKTVLAWKEPMKNGWLFMLDGQKWTASDYAFKE